MKNESQLRVDRMMAERAERVALKDSDGRETFATGSVRDARAGKGRFDLLLEASRALTRVAKHFETGAEKYGDSNWTKGQPLRRYLDSATRHLTQFAQGKTDEAHLDAALWNLLCLADTQERIKEGLLPKELNDL